MINTIIVLMTKEIRDAMRSWWLLLYAVLFTLLALALSFLGQKNLGALGFENFSRTTASLVNLCLLLTPLIALSLGAGTIAGEREQGTLTYLLSQPVTRREILLGKFAGLVSAIGIATIGGFGVAGVVIALYGSTMDVGIYLAFLGLVLALVAVMTGLGLVASVLSPTRVQALGMSLMVWFAAIFLFDLLLIGMISTVSVGEGWLLLAVLINPIEIVRVLAILQLEPDLEVLGPFGAFVIQRLGTTGATVLLSGALVAWVAGPLYLATSLFEREGPRYERKRLGSNAAASARSSRVQGS
jgi:ABC-type transport system involved in multi-copper enzyme maturation permease subunit